MTFASAVSDAGDATAARRGARVGGVYARGGGGAWRAAAPRTALAHPGVLPVRGGRRGRVWEGSGARRCAG
eukprot:scaffold92296_cov75-Phaeocystis_antarctica.AAC.2